MDLEDKPGLVALAVAGVLVLVLSYAGYGYYREYDQVDIIWSRLEKRFIHTPVPEFELIDIIRPGKDLITHDYGFWTFVGLRQELPEPFDSVLPEGICDWAVCVRDGSGCTKLMDCGRGFCAGFREKAANYPSLSCTDISGRLPRSGWEKRTR